ncbi:FAD-dependent oxidoreductase [Burkholderia multivorans]|uniref:NAD(P)/FAD-dependent oxidoreductase n=1 Tax=Burkholderia multivorans TaxID=87883 RepID=UPI001C2344BE|nr:FAD-binding oxidoreductase [Burkholderia multivorans]MDN7450870.1 FAD-dependent oxidoreductase [Burkholderia multivorans]
MSDNFQDRVVVVGAGIVGLCVAYEVRKAGFEVTVIDPNPVASQCSSGNAGAISSRAVAPLAMPGLMKTVPSMLLDPSSPLYIPANYILSAAPWLMKFIASAKPERVREIAAGLNLLHDGAVKHHQALAEEVGCRDRVRATGQLYLYVDDNALAKDQGSWALKKSYGLIAEELDRRGIESLEPEVSARYQRGLFLPDQGWVSEPLEYARCIETAARSRGVRFIEASVERITRDGGMACVQMQGQQLRASHVVLAAGAWSSKLLSSSFDISVPLESQRGYHVQMKLPGVSLSRQVVLADRKVFVTPMEKGLRFAGTVEFGGLEREPNPRRAMILAKHALEALPALSPDAPLETWMGHRPCFPDSLPAIGPVPYQPGIWCAFGHGHLGLTGSAKTGKLIAGLLKGRIKKDLVSPFAVERFV